MLVWRDDGWSIRWRGDSIFGERPLYQLLQSLSASQSECHVWMSSRTIELLVGDSDLQDNLFVYKAMNMEGIPCVASPPRWRQACNLIRVCGL